MYSDDDLMDKRLDYLREITPAEYRRLKKDGELDEHLQYKAARCRKEVARMQEKEGVSEVQAWQWAIREVLLDTPRD